MKIRFLGAARTVTGSRFLVEQNDERILIDCGLYQERDFRSRNWDPFPVDPASIQAILLTHAHIDHCGYLPKLVQQGFSGPIYCTPPTEEITKISLLDSARLQVSDAEFKRKRHQREGRKAKFSEDPLYTVDDAQDVFQYFKSVNYQKEIVISQHIKAIYYDAGHILGSASIMLIVNDNGESKKVVFSGDIGRWHRPLLCDPHPFNEADYLIMEATYGNRRHEKEDSALEKLAEVINKTHKAGGNVVIPAFAVERTQEILYDLNKLLKENRIPHILTFVDSPMAIDVTKIFSESSDFFDKEAKEKLREYETLFSFPLLKMTKSAEESKMINHIKGTAIIIAGSGMCTGGRVKHHLVANISRPESTILFVGYQAVGTLGREIVEKPKDVRILGQRFTVKANIEKINGFSGHADKDELLQWVSSLKDSVKEVFIVHSEEKVALEFSKTLEGVLNKKIHVPEYLQEVVI
ncbi:MAG: MBL fold metallo-hydrolase [Candidatus Omnitrophica bacterium]|nr:MBL fold metallo-hydrolase [Candidatus Omnitrophota bacterium]